MKMRHLVLVLLCWVTVAVTMSGQSGSAQEALEAARKTAVVDGDLPGAIKQYDAIVVRFEKTDRATAAQALLLMAECYEKQRSAEAQRVYGRVIKEYPEQTALVAEAQQRVQGRTDEGLASRLVWDGCCVSAVSRDGRYLIYIENSDLAVRDLSTSETRLLTNPPSTSGQRISYASDAQPSPDGREIAYTWFSEAQRYEVRVIAREGGRPRVLMAGDPHQAIYVKGWTPYGQIVVTRGPDDAGVARDVVLIPSVGGAPRVARYYSRVGSNARVSPDGKVMAYSRPAAPNQRERDLFVLSLDTGAEAPLLTHVADDYVLDWLPDGRLLFGSDRSGSWGIWLTRMAEGRAVGEPVLIQSHATRPVSFGTSSNSELYFGTPAQDLDIYLATLDSEAGRLQGELTRVPARTSGRKRAAAWSPDGAQFAFVQPPTPTGVSGLVRFDEFTIGLLTIATGAIKLRTLPLAFAHSPAWMPDGKSLVILGTDRTSGEQGLLQLDLGTGGLTLVGERGSDAGIAPNGRLFFIRRDSPASIVVRDVMAGTEEIVFSGRVSGFALSSEGQWLAVIRQGTQDPQIFIMRSDGGTQRDLSNEVLGWTIPVQPVWSSDGQNIFVVRRTAAGDGIWRIPVDGSAPQNTGITWLGGSIERISAHPTDNHRLALSTSKTTHATWVLRNLPQFPLK